MRVWLLAILVILLMAPTVVIAQGTPPPHTRSESGGYNPDPKLGLQDHTRGQRPPARTLPPPLTLPASMGGQVIPSSQRDHPHSPIQADKNNPMAGHTFGSPHAPAPALPPGVQLPRSEEDPSLHLMGVSEQGGTYCVLAAIGGPLGLPYLDSLYGEGWFGCSNPLWVYYTLQNLSVWRCWYSIGGWCLPTADQFITYMGSCDQRLSQQIQWCGPFYGYEPGGTYFVRNEGYVAAPSGFTSDYVDSGLFNLP